jgi:hypothetical protein
MRVGLRKRKREEAPQNTEPKVTEEWIDEDKLELWEIKQYNDRYTSFLFCVLCWCDACIFFFPLGFPGLITWLLLGVELAPRLPSSLWNNPPPPLPSSRKWPRCSPQRKSSSSWSRTSRCRGLHFNRRDSRMGLLRSQIY